MRHSYLGRLNDSDLGPRSRQTNGVDVQTVFLGVCGRLMDCRFWQLKVVKSDARAIEGFIREQTWFVSQDPDIIFSIISNGGEQENESWKGLILRAAREAK